MHKGFFSVLFSVAILIVALSLASAVGAQETTSAETTPIAGDAADRRVEAKTDNVTVEVDNGHVSAKTGDGSSSGAGTGPQSSLTVQQNQTDEGRGSRAASGDVNTDQNSNSSCQNAREVLSVGPITNNIRRAFETTGDTFRVTYDVTFTASSDEFRSFDIEIEDNFGLVEFAIEDDDASNSFVVTEGAGNYDLVTRVQPPNGARYTVTIDDCGRNNNGNNGNNNNNNDGRDRNRGAADHQYKNEKVVKETVIKNTIPDKGTLANTGGVPLTGAAFLALASVGLGLSILRFAIRRDP